MYYLSIRIYYNALEPFNVYTMRNEHVVKNTYKTLSISYMGFTIFELIKSIK